MQRSKGDRIPLYIRVHIFILNNEVKFLTMMIRNANRNISVAKGHGYTLSKVKFAKDFVEKSGRNTTIQDWVDAYNYIKDANETAQGCQACKAAKFTAAVRNYARYGYMTLLNEGYSPSDFEEPVKVDEISSVTVVEGPVVEDTSVTSAEVVSEVTVELPVVDVQANEVFTEDEQEQDIEQVVKEVNDELQVERPKAKRGGKKSKK